MMTSASVVPHEMSAREGGFVEMSGLVMTSYDISTGS